MEEAVLAAMQEIADRAEVGIEILGDQRSDYLGATEAILNEIIELTRQFTHPDETVPEEIHDLVVVLAVIANARKSAYQAHLTELWHSYAAGYSVIETRLAQLGYRVMVDGTIEKLKKGKQK